MIPVLYLPLGTSWNVRNNVVAGEIKLLNRYAYFQLEEVTSQARNISNKGSTLYHYILLVDLNQYNLRKHGCAGCK